MEHLYLSPHLDDAVWSCGGAIARQTGQGEQVMVLTIFAGDPPNGPLSPFARCLQDRWGGQGLAVAMRREEDRRACAILGAEAVHLGFLDCVYRVDERGSPLYRDERAIFGDVHAVDQPLPVRLATAIDQHVARASRVYCPLGMGGHVDHRLTRAAAESVAEELWLYPDMPYAIRGEGISAGAFIPKGSRRLIPVTGSQREMWERAALQYASQISSFWQSPAGLRKDIRQTLRDSGGILMIESA
jgi:LmbE family N-acetylglucosaminyl deacetylase